MAVIVCFLVGRVGVAVEAGQEFRGGHRVDGAPRKGAGRVGAAVAVGLEADVRERVDDGRVGLVAGGFGVDVAEEPAAGDGALEAPDPGVGGGEGGAGLGPAEAGAEVVEGAAVAVEAGEAAGGELVGGEPVAGAGELVERLQEFVVGDEGDPGGGVVAEERGVGEADRGGVGVEDAVVDVGEAAVLGDAEAGAAGVPDEAAGKTPAMGWASRTRRSSRVKTRPVSIAARRRSDCSSAVSSTALTRAR
nr:hypothetical protein GCM10025732_46870 [Glycomyces mayteni]